MRADIGSSGLGVEDTKFYGNFRGKVVDNADPGQFGRIKVQVYPMFATIAADLLPWAVPAMPLTSGAGSGIGSFCVPDIGAYVWLFFEMGDIYQPVYFAEAQDGVHGLPTSRVTNYPNRRIVKFASGIELYVDDTAVAVQLNHPAGASISIDSAGLITILGGQVVIQGLTSVNINPL